MTELPETWRWKIRSFKPRHLLPLVDPGSGPTSFIDAYRLRPLEQRTTLLECELGTWTEVLAPISLALYCAGPFFRTGRDYFQTAQLPLSFRRRLGKGLYLRLRADNSQSYPHPYEYTDPSPFGSPVDWLSLLRQYLPFGQGQARQTQVALIEEFEQSQRLAARGGADLSNEDYYIEKLAIKRSMLEPDFLSRTQLQGLVPFSVWDKAALQSSLAAYLGAFQRGEPY